MNKNIKSYKAFLAGFLFAVVLFAGKNIFALGMKVQAYLCDDYKIEVDGVEVKVPDGMRILNYIDRTYTPARLIAEEMGGTVKWDEASKTIKITKPKPKIVEKVIEKEVEVPVESKNNNYYQSLPVKLNKKDFSLEITGINIKDNLTYVYIDAENKTGETVDILYDQAEIKSLDNNNIYLSNVMSSQDWGDSMQTDEKRNGKVMYFDGINKDNKKITLRIPVKSLFGDSYNEVFEYNINLD